MHGAVTFDRSDLEALCRKYGVRRLELFGSAARDDFDPARSDIDLLVDLDDPPHGRVMRTIFGLKDELEELFGRPVDLVMPQAVRNPYLKADIDRDRTLLYAA